METPRPHEKAQPEIHFAGCAAAYTSDRAHDPAINAAFIGFQQKISAGLGLAAARRPINATTLALSALALLGFGGGLGLAFFSFNTPENSRSAVAARAPEIIYTAPAVVERSSAPTEPPAALIASGSAGFLTATTFDLRAEEQPLPETSLWREIDRPQVDVFSSSAPNSEAPLFAAAAAGEMAFPGEGPAEVGNPEITGDFGALTVATVPEPSTWATMIMGAGLLLLSGKLKRRRR